MTPSYLSFCLPGINRRLTWSMLQQGWLPLIPCRLPFSGPLYALSDTITRACSTGHFNDALRALTLGSQMAHEAAPLDLQLQWKTRLLRSAIYLEQRQVHSAAAELQRTLAWRNRCEAAHSFVQIHSQDWLTMASIALGRNDIESAEQYAAKAWNDVTANPLHHLSDILRDDRADVLTVLGAISFARRELTDAARFFSAAADGHRQAADVEQLVIDLIYQSDVELFREGDSAARSRLLEAFALCRDGMCPERHPRQISLKRVIANRFEKHRLLQKHSSPRCGLN